MAPARLSGRCARARPLPRARRGPRSPGRRLPGWRRWKSGPTRGWSRDGARRARSPAPRQLQGQTRGPPAPISPPQRRVKRWCSLPARAAAGNGVCEAVTGGGGAAAQGAGAPPPPRPGLPNAPRGLQLRFQLGERQWHRARAPCASSCLWRKALQQQRLLIRCCPRFPPSLSPLTSSSCPRVPGPAQPHTEAPSGALPPPWAPTASAPGRAEQSWLRGQGHGRGLPLKLHEAEKSSVGGFTTSRVTAMP